MALARERNNSPIPSYIYMNSEMEAVESLEENMLDSAPFPLSMKDIRVDEVLVLQPEARSQNSTSESPREDKSMQERRKPGLGGCRQTGLVRSRADGLKLSPGLPSMHADTNHHGENGCKLKELYSSHTGSRVAWRLVGGRGRHGDSRSAGSPAGPIAIE